MSMRGASSLRAKRDARLAPAPERGSLVLILMPLVMQFWNTLFQNVLYCNGGVFWPPSPAKSHLSHARAQLGVTLLNDRPEQGDQAQNHDRAHEAVGEKHPERALRPEQRLSERFFRLVAKHDGEH